MSTALTSNSSLQPTCYGWLRQPAQAAELKRWADKAVTYEFLAILIGGIEYR